MDTFVRFDHQIRQVYSPESKHSWVSPVSTYRPFATRTDDVDVRVSSGSAIVFVGVGESTRALVGEFGLGADPSKTPGGICPKRIREYCQTARELEAFTEW